MSTGGQSIVSRELRRQFGDFVAVRDVSFEVERGEIFGYLGANGAGKSTTIRMLCGLLAPTAGSATVAGHDIATSPLKVKASIGYMSQKFSLYRDLVARHNLEFFGGIYGLGGKSLDRAIDYACERTGLTDAELKSPTDSLPGGLRQRLALAGSLIHDPEIVFLDEPTAGVDPISRRDFWKLIRSLASEGKTIFVTTHYMDEAEYCARVGLMVDGELAALDTPDALKEKYVPGRTIALHGQELHRAAAAIRSLDGVVAAESFGASLRVRLDAEFSLGLLDAPLEAAGASLDAIEDDEASLEDVFLAVVGEGLSPKEAA